MRRAYAMYALFLCFSRNMKLICPFAPHTADDSMNYVSINKNFRLHHASVSDLRTFN